MLLAIDAGNTNIVFALCDGGEIVARWRIATDPKRTADEYAVWLNQLLALEKRGMEDVDAVIIGTVVPRALHNLQTLSRHYFNVEPLVAGHGDAAWPGMAARLVLQGVCVYGALTMMPKVLIRRRSTRPAGPRPAPGLSVGHGGPST